MIDALPGELREQTKSFLSQSLKAVVSRRCWSKRRTGAGGEQS